MKALIQIFPAAMNLDGISKFFDNLMVITKTSDEAKWKCPVDGSRDIQVVDYFNLNEIVLNCCTCNKMFTRAISSVPTEEPKVREI